MKYFKTKKNFLGIPEEELYSYESSKVVIQSLPYEYTSSYKSGSAAGPQAIIDSSAYVELYDEELDQETYRKVGICTLKPLEFEKKVDEKAVNLITKETRRLLNDDKFVVSLGAEHTVTFGIFRAFQEKFENLSILQIDAHSDLRMEYHGNPYSHASVMARIYETGAKIAQVGIRAQCIEEAELIKSSKSIKTVYAHQLRNNATWQDEILKHLTKDVYITIDADGFDPSVIPNVGTAEPGGMQWYETLEFLKKVASKKNVVGFDVVEVAPQKGSIISEYTLAKLVYRLLGYIHH